MKLIIIVFFLFLLCFINVRLKDSISRVIAFSFLLYWFLSLFISTYTPYDFYTIRDITYVIFLFGVLSFIIGFSIPSISANSDKFKFTYEDQIDSIICKLISNKYFLGLYLFIIIYCLKFVKAALISSAINEGVINEDRLQNIFLGDGIAALLYNNFMFPLFHMGIAVVVYSFVKKKIKILPTIIIALYVVEFSILQGGRSIFMIIFLYIIVIYCSANSYLTLRKIKLKQILYGGVIFILVVIAMMHMTSYRSTGEFSISAEDRQEYFDDTMNRIVEYSVLPLVLFDISLEDDYLNQLGGYKYGRATFTGVDLVIRGILKRLGISYNSTQDIVDYVQNTWRQVSPEAYYNYAYTALFYHYMDFGILGIFLFPFLFGLIYRCIIKEYYRRPSPPMLFILCVSYFMMMHSIFTCYFIKTWIMMYVIVLFYWHLSINKRHKLCIQI